MSESRLQYLFRQYINKSATADEREELSRLLEQEENKAIFPELMQQTWQTFDSKDRPLSQEKTEAMLTEIMGRKTVPIATVRTVKWWRVAAAAVLLILAAFTYTILTNKPGPEPAMADNAPDIEPASFEAKLTLDDGTVIILDSTAMGQLAKEGNTSIVNRGGQLMYETSSNETQQLYNTVATAKGETYSLTLSDGTQVWLNSGSSIRFPVAFNGNERRVITSGEVYLKIARNIRKPFIAESSGMEVLALGTEFNINTYDDGDYKSATLIEGAVEVSKGNKTVKLSPGKQTKFTTDGKLHEPYNVDIDEVTAWKEGLFYFENANLKQILREFERWYDVEVLFEGTVTERKFFAVVSRKSSLKTVLKMLQDNSINFRIEGKKLIVKSG